MQGQLRRIEVGSNVLAKSHEPPSSEGLPSCSAVWELLSRPAPRQRCALAHVGDYSTVEARKLEYDRPLIPKQKKDGKPV